MLDTLIGKWKNSIILPLQASSYESHNTRIAKAWLPEENGRFPYDDQQPPSKIRIDQFFEYLHIILKLHCTQIDKPV